MHPSSRVVLLASSPDRSRWRFDPSTRKPHHQLPIIRSTVCGTVFPVHGAMFGPFVASTIVIHSHSTVSMVATSSSCDDSRLPFTRRVVLGALPPSVLSFAYQWTSRRGSDFCSFQSILRRRSSLGCTASFVGTRHLVRLERMDVHFGCRSRSGTSCAIVFPAGIHPHLFQVVQPCTSLLLVQHW